MTTDTTSNGMREAMSFLRQERRFFREALQRRGFLSRLFSAAPADDVSLDGELEVKQQRIINESAQRNELGLYRNASLTLALSLIHI